MTISKITTLVNTFWLREQILCRGSSLTKRNLKVLDTSWMPEPEVDGYKQFYQESHIPTSLYFDLKKVSPPVPGSSIKFQIPSTNLFQEYVGNLGITNNTHVVAYDRFNTRPSFRTWFLFKLFGHDKVSVLNGGLRKWLTDGFHVTTEEPVVEKEQFKVMLRKHLLRDFEAIQTNLQTAQEQLMDARGIKDYYVTDDGNSGGHIPGAKNIPFSSLFNEDGTVKAENELKKLFDEAGINLTKPLVSSCQTGMTACGLIAAAHILGKDDVALYNGSYHEWSARADASQIVKEKQGKEHVLNQ
ncbi:thiosulfate sulfurtransferase-like isoform X2 [Physella acuta]|nr:thiosulfate sulfurtransferase-like isoform X2 [Physella acuta]XP_059178186.1 thiosulfate sulfurtransferase-like isoform X2 [Physella acuta]XP_059178187.1 thiosulfate sulfurtransferase-like isoform X2 [Physella acuta]XP_059178188.1 thiosulfate sulfurtransferase-like isoform X2 [Physella acuta]